MGKRQKILTICLWSVLLLTMVGVVAAKFVWPRVSKAEPPPVLYPAGSYAGLVDQDGAPFSSQSLAGKPYVACFMFTSCNMICPRMNGHMVKLQRELPKEFHLASFTVDPAIDTPAKLKAYGQVVNADNSRWHFLTGDKEKLVDAAKNLKLPYVDWPQNHSGRILLIDAAGNIRGAYESNDDGQIAQLLKDAKTVAAEGGRS
jgi:cytochrome oxidase Cu insertion factor (SCO1/SenC/PrrC family)